MKSIDTLIEQRFSPKHFADRPVSEEHLHQLFEAARWAPSSYNEQPWRFIYATQEQPEAHQQLLSCINEHNQQWAKNAPVLMLSLAKKNFSRNGKPNRMLGTIRVLLSDFFFLKPLRWIFTLTRWRASIPKKRTKLSVFSKNTIQ